MKGVGIHQAPSWRAGRALLGAAVVVLTMVALLGLSGSASAQTVIFSDDFEAGLSGWTLTSHPDWQTGDPKNGNYSIRLRANEAIERLIPTSDYEAIVVSFALAAYSLDNVNEYVTASWYDGAAWRTLKEIRGGQPENDGVLRTYTYALPAAASDNAGFRLKFAITSSSHANDYGFVDDVALTGERKPKTLTITGSGSGAVRVDGVLQALPWTGSYPNGTVVALEAVPAAGWDFTSWSGGVSGSANPTTVTMSGNRSVTATFSQLQYTLSLAGVGGGTVRVNGANYSLPWSGQFLSGSVVTLEAVPATGWEFTSWSGDVGGSANPTALTMDGPRSAVAAFGQIERTLTLTGVGSGSARVNGTLRALPWSGTFYHGDSVTLEAVPDAGWRFDGWSGDASWSGATLTVTMDANKSITATFGQLQYTLSLAKVGSGSARVNGTLRALPWSGSFYHGDSVTLEAVPDAGWRFDGWSGDASWSGATLTVTMDANKSLTATFSNASFTLSLSKVGSGSVRVDGVTRTLPWSGQFAAGAQVTLEAMPGSGWRFQAWSGDANWSGATLTVTMTADKSITAEFAERTTFLLKITQSGSGSVRVNGSPVSIPYQAEWPRDAQVALEAAPAAEWTFSLWSDDLAGATANPATVTMNRDWEVKAEFTQVFYTVSIAGSGSGSVKVNGTTRALPWSGSFASGAAIALEALPDAGWQFGGWSGGVSGSTNPVTVTVTGSLTIQATFTQPETFTLRVTRIGAGAVKVDGVEQDLPWTGVIPNGAEVEIEAVPDVDGEFVEWSGAAAGPSNPITVVMDSDKQVTAHFACQGSVFGDVACDHWAAQAIAALNGAGISQGYPDELYRPDLVVDRASMAVFLARALCGGDEAIPEPPDAPTFSDVPETHWAYAAIEYVVDCGIAKGYASGTYQPTWSVTRAHMAGFIARAIVRPMGDEGLAGYTAPATPSFDDVSETHWAYRYIEYLVSVGIADGYGDGYYRPTANVTRDQMAVFVARAFELID